MNPPKYTASRADGHAAAKATRVIVLSRLLAEGRLGEMNKTEIAKLLGVSRWTLDRDIATIELIQPKIDEMYERLVKEIGGKPAA